jgi:hypothetical protein
MQTYFAWHAGSQPARGTTAPQGPQQHVGGSFGADWASQQQQLTGKMHAALPANAKPLKQHACSQLTCCNLAVLNTAETAAAAYNMQATNC